MDSFKRRVTDLQAELKAPKGQYNSFGRYKYRSCEDILEAVKPLAAKYAVCFTVSDDVVSCSDRIYIKATATVRDTESDEFLSVTAFAREAAEKKGMDDSQVSGTASSYARKYALNGLLLVDDTKDADTEEYTQNAGQAKAQKPKSEAEQPCKCELCGAVIVPDPAFKNKSGNPCTVEEIVRGSKKKYNHALCVPCIARYKQRENKQ